MIVPPRLLGRAALGSRLVGAWVMVVLLLLPAGCAVLPPMPAAVVPSAIPVLIERFSLSGRLSVRIADRLDAVRIEWERDGKRETMRFFSPFGSQLAEVVSGSEGTTLTRGDVVEYAKSVGALTESVIGVAIDTDLLARWVQGMSLEPTPGQTNDGRVVRWTIRAENIRAVDGVDGGRIASRISATEGETSIRLVVDSFKPI